jgi:hypothetical protein
MNQIKKYLAYFVIIAALVAAALLVSKLRELDARALHPDSPGAETAGANRPERGAIFTKPAESGRMSSSELAWMLREKVALDVMERMVSGGNELDAYNARSSEYNELASAVAYSEGDMAAAVRVVEAAKGEIVSEAIDEAMALATPESVSGDSSAGATWRAQKYLSVMGYYPGPVDGKENKTTSDAIKKLEIKAGVPATGRADESLAEKLREAWITQNIPQSVSFGK